MFIERERESSSLTKSKQQRKESSLQIIPKFKKNEQAKLAKKSNSKRNKAAKRDKKQKSKKNVKGNKKKKSHNRQKKIKKDQRRNKKKSNGTQKKVGNEQRRMKKKSHSKQKKVEKDQRTNKKKGQIRKKKNQKRKHSKANSGRVKKQKQGENSCTMYDDCLMNLIDFVQTAKEKIKNYERQKKRILKKNKILQNKNSKKDNFQDILEILNETVGVNGTGCVSPSSSFQNESANLLENLSSCSGAIESACVVDVDLSNETGNN